MSASGLQTSNFLCPGLTLQWSFDFNEGKASLNEPRTHTTNGYYFSNMSSHIRHACCKSLHAWLATITCDFAVTECPIHLALCNK